MRTAAPPGPDPWDPARAVWSPTASGHLLRACSLPGPSTLQLRQLWPWVEAHRALGAPLGIDGTGACPSATMRGSSRAPGPPPTGSGRNSTGWGRSTWGGRGQPRPGCGVPTGRRPPPTPSAVTPVVFPTPVALRHFGQHSRGRDAQEGRAATPTSPSPRLGHAQTRVCTGPQGRHSLAHTHTRVHVRGLNPCHSQRATRCGVNVGLNV